MKKNKCTYCEREVFDYFVSPSTLLLKTRDHIIPISARGNSSDKNIVSSCFQCNNIKGSRTLEDFIKNVSELSCESVGREYFLLIPIVMRNAELLAKKIAPYRLLLYSGKKPKKELPKVVPIERLKEYPFPTIAEINKLARQADHCHLSVNNNLYGK